MDFLIGGSPCTYWSIAQTKNRETVASGMGWELFSQYVRALKEAKPKYFIYENNKSMSKQIRQSIDEAFGFEAVLINSALVSAQNRQRLYWVGRRNDDGTYSRVYVEQPENRGILLKDVLDSAVAQDLTSGDKAYALTASYDGAAAWNTIERHQRNMVAEPILEDFPPFVDERIDNIVEKVGHYPEMWNPYNNAEITEKAPTQTAQCASWTKSSTCVVAEPINITADGKSQTIKAQYQQTSPANICCYTSTYGASGVAIPTGEKPSEQFDGKGKDLDAMKRVYEVKDGLITIKGKQYPIKLKDGYYIIRKLTVSECKRLQTVPEWYEFPVSNSQAYKMLGNGWTCEVITHLIKSCLDGTTAEYNFEETEAGTQYTLF